MKKILLFAFAILSSFCYAQIGPIQATKPVRESIAANLYLDTRDSSLYFYIFSTNEFERENVKITLGNSYKEAIESLTNLLTIYDQEGMEFDMQNHSFVVQKDRIRIKKNRHLYYTAGEYYIYRFTINQYIKAIEKRISAE